MNRREEKKDYTQKQILSAAATLFAERGYDSTSIDDIASKANVAKGTLYYHFDSKEAVVVALRVESFADTLNKAVAAFVKGEKPVSILESILLERAAWTEKNPDLARVFLEQRIHQFLFRDDDPLVLVGARRLAENAGVKKSKGTNGKQSNGTGSGDTKKAVSTFPELVHELVVAGQKSGVLRTDLNSSELAQIIIATFLHAQGSWLGGYSSTSLVDKVHRWFHAVLDGLYA